MIELIASAVGLIALGGAFWAGKRWEKGQWDAERLSLAERHNRALKEWMDTNDKLHEEKKELQKNVHDAFVRGATVADIMHAFELRQEDKH